MTNKHCQFPAPRYGHFVIHICPIHPVMLPIWEGDVVKDYRVSIVATNDH